MTKVERQMDQLYSVLKKSKQLSLSESMELLQVSESTIRRLFIALEKKGVAIRKYGAIQLSPTPSTIEYSYDLLSSHNAEKKEVIGVQAASLISNDDILFLDSGTTAFQVCCSLEKRLAKGSLRNISVFTNSLVNLNILNSYSTVNLIGGEYRKNRKDFCGYLSEEMLNRLHFTKCFLGCDGYQISNGFCATDFHTARINEIALKNSDMRYIVMDCSKFLVSSVVSFSKGIPVNAIITDDFPTNSILLEHFNEQKIKIIIAGLR